MIILQRGVFNVTGIINANSGLVHNTLSGGCLGQVSGHNLLNIVATGHIGHLVQVDIVKIR